MQKGNNFELYIQLKGVDENGNEPKSQLSISINPDKLGNVNWDVKFIPIRY